MDVQSPGVTELLRVPPAVPAADSSVARKFLYQDPPRISKSRRWAIDVPHLSRRFEDRLAIVLRAKIPTSGIETASFKSPSLPMFTA